MRRYVTITAMTAGLFFAVVAVAFAHDIWLSPNRFALMKGDTLLIRMLAGTELDAEHDLPLERTMTPRFELITANRTIDLLAELPDFRTQPTVQPVLERMLDFEGPALVTMEHDFIYTQFTREEFLEYLEHEEFDLSQFEPFMGKGSAETERYARTLKCLVQVGESGAGDVYNRVVGLKLEIVLLQNPYRLDPGDALDVQILYEGEPLPNKLVMAFNRGDQQPVTKATARTDENGIARFALDRAGPWLIRLVHMMSCDQRDDLDCDDAFWESYWTSYSFAVN